MASGSERFAFGRNWKRFARELPPEALGRARDSIRTFTGLASLEGLRVLDVGSGSGLFSTAALELGASELRAFDYDADSVECTRALLEAKVPDGPWEVTAGDVTDADFMAALGTFDLVYAWGVLHHTGHMWRALEHTMERVGEGGLLYVALYNDQGALSAVWREVKRGYHRCPEALRPVYVGLAVAPKELARLGASVIRGRPMDYVRGWTEYGANNRGMSRWRDHVDWVGGLPFEVARPDEILAFSREHGFTLENMQTVGGRLGCNEFLLRRTS